MNKPKLLVNNFIYHSELIDWYMYKYNLNYVDSEEKVEELFKYCKIIFVGEKMNDIWKKEFLLDYPEFLKNGVHIVYEN